MILGKSIETVATMSDFKAKKHQNPISAGVYFCVNGMGGTREGRAVQSKILKIDPATRMSRYRYQKGRTNPEFTETRDSEWQ